VLAPDNTFTGTLIQQDTSTAGHWLAKGGINQQVVQTTSRYTLSVFVKKYGSTSTVTLGETDNFNSGGYTKAGIVFNFDTEQFIKSYQWSSSSFSLISAYSATKFANGWYRLSLTVIPGSDANSQKVYPAIGPGDLTAGFTLQSIPTGATGVSGANYNSPGIANFAGNGTTGVYVWGYDVQIGAFPTSYIPTPASFTSRASTATFYDSAGIIQTAAINTARSNAFFPDSSGVMRPAGLLLESSSTNGAFYSEDFNQWVQGSVILTTNAITAPDGTTTADKIVETATSASHHVRQVTSSSAGTYTVSVYAKSDGSNRLLNLAVEYNPSTYIFSYFNLTTGTVSNVSAGVIANIIKLPNGWYRCSVTLNTISFARPWFMIAASSGEGYIARLGDGISGFYIWGAQVETGSYATSYIPTTSSTVTRAADVSTSATVTRSADVASITGANFSSWYNQSEGTYLIDAITLDGSTATNTTQDTLFDDGYVYIQDYVGASVRRRVIESPSGGFNFNPAQAPARKTAVAFNSSSANAAYDGVLQAVDTTISGLPNAASSLHIGIRTSASAPVDQATISRLTYWPTRLPDSTLITLTR
jgi:hypothetical protein